MLGAMPARRTTRTPSRTTTRAVAGKGARKVAGKGARKPKASRDAAPGDKPGRLELLTAIACSLPQVETELVNGRHVRFRVGRKTFAWYTDDHHGDGRIALHCKAARGEQARLVASDPQRYFVPPYVGPAGWVGLRLDLPALAWPELTGLLTDAFRLSAPRKLVALLEAQPPDRRE
jgi:hypothetical protein